MGVNIPTEYQQVEWIESSGSTQYINTGIIPTTSDVCEVDFMPVGNSSASYYPILAAFEHAYLAYAVPTSGNTISFTPCYYNWISSPEISVSQPKGTRIRVLCRYDDADRNHAATVYEYYTGTLLASNATTTLSRTQATPYAIFGRMNNGSGDANYKSDFKLYSLKLWQNNVLVIDAVPCYRKSDGVIGLYNKISGAFWVNQGTGTFTKGPDYLGGIKANSSVTIIKERDVASTWRYYLLRSSTLAPPTIDDVTVRPPTTGGVVWTLTEPSYTSGSTNNLYLVDCTVFTDGNISYSQVSLSSSFEAAKAAYNKAVVADNKATEAAKTATNYITTDASGIKVHRQGSAGDYAHIDNTGMQVFVGGIETSSFGASRVQLGKNSATSQVEMCGGKAGVSARYGGIIDVYSNNADWDTTLDFDFDETTFKTKVNNTYDFYDFIYTEADGWELIENSYQQETGPVTMSQFGITVHTTELNDYAGIQVSFIEGSHVKVFNTDTQTGSRKLELELAEGSSTAATDYANITIERQTQEYEGGDTNEHSIINLMTLHDGGNSATLQLYDGEISFDAVNIYFSSGPVYDRNMNKMVGCVVGEMKLYAGDSDTFDYEGWLICDGSELDRVDYALLFEAIGTTYGAGDGSSTFNIPDMRGRVPVGTNSTYPLGATGGSPTHTLTEAQIPAHTHGSAGAHTHGINNCSAAGSGASQLESYASGNNKNRSISTKSAGAHTHTSFGGSGAHNNMQPYVSLNYIIYTGAIFA